MNKQNNYEIINVFTDNKLQICKYFMKYLLKLLSKNINIYNILTYKKKIQK